MFRTHSPSAQVAVSVADGVRVILLKATGASLLDVVIPPGAVDPVTKVGWKAGGSGFSWNGNGSLGGFTKIGISGKSGTFKFKVGGAKGTYPLAANEVPVRATISLDPTSFIPKDCVKAPFVGSGGSCALTPDGKTLRCK